MGDQNKRAMLVEAVIAGGLIAIGIPAGQLLLPLAAAATSVGCNWTYSLAERAFQHWRDGWFADDGVLNHDITKALRHAFVDTIRQVEHDWRQHRHYQHLQRKSPEEAQLTLAVLRLLREEGATLFQQPNHLTQIIQQEQQNRVLSLLYQDEFKANEYLKPVLAAFLYGHDEEFVTFVTEQLGPKWILRFLEILKDPDEEGTRAWRACQLLWQKSLMLGIEQIQQTTAGTADAVHWLQAWAQQLRSLPPTERNPIGQDALETILHSVHAQLGEMQNTLDKTYATTLNIKDTLEKVYKKAVDVEIDPSLKQQAQPSTVLRDRDEQKNREHMLRRVYSIWIEGGGRGVLEHSLHRAVLIALGLQEQPDALENPWRMIMQEMEQSPRPLPDGTRITQVYDEADGELLILGAPGAGKTTLLLELTRDLLDRAKEDVTHPIPVIFNLSSWAEKRQSLSLWLIEELNTKYLVPRPLSQSWIEQDQLLLLLDGLDEVEMTARKECVEALNEYHKSHGLVPLVVCSRSAEYFAKKTHLLLRRAVAIQPLTQEQIDKYLASAGNQLVGLHSLLSNNPDLQMLATNPLMLSIFSLAYQGQPVEDFVAESPDKAQQQLFTMYVKRTLQRRAVTTIYSSQQTIQWLAWLASQLKRSNQSEFYLERMQADWLANKQAYRLSSNLVVGCVLVLFGLLAYWLFYGFHFGLFIGLIDGLIVGLYLGFVYVSLDSFVLEWFKKLSQNTRSALEREKRGSNKQYTLGKFLESEILFGCLGGILVGPLIGFLMIGPQYTIFSKLTYGLYNVLIMGLLFGLIGRLGAEIQPAEVVAWSWGGIKQRLGMGVFFGLCIGLVLWPIFSVHGPSAILFGLLIGLVCGSLISMSGGLSHTMLDKSNLFMPNQGIRRSLRNGVSLGLIGGSIGGAFIGLACGIEGGPINGLVYGLSSGIYLAGMIGYREGGRACIQHFTLRVLLWHSGALPLNLPQFLDYCTERILLSKRGGGYAFIHRLLLEHFASLDP